MVVVASVIVSAGIGILLGQKLVAVSVVRGIVIIIIIISPVAGLRLLSQKRHIVPVESVLPLIVVGVPPRASVSGKETGGRRIGRSRHRRRRWFPLILHLLHPTSPAILRLHG